MKKILIITSLSFAILGFAQKKKTTNAGSKNTKTSSNTTSTKENKIQFGLKGGGNLSWISGEDKYRIFSEKVGYHGGIAVRYDLSSKIKVQAETLWNNIGTNSVERENKNGKAKVQMDYITVPILAQYHFKPQLYVETGPEISYNINSVFVVKDGKTYDWKESTKKINFAWSIGAGYYFTPNIAANVRMNLGLMSPFFDTETTNAEMFRHQNLQLGVLYFFN